MGHPKSAIEDALQLLFGNLALEVPAAPTLATVAPGTILTARKTNTGIAAVHDTLNLVRDFHRPLERVVHCPTRVSVDPFWNGLAYMNLTDGLF